MNDMSGISENLDNIYSEIEAAAKKSGRSASDIQLMAVSKTKPMSLLLEAYDGGMRLFGENRVQEGSDKRKELPADAQIHLIGHLQSNKVKQAVGVFACIQSVDSLKLASKINNRAEELGIVQDILLELKTAGDDEYDKTGFRGENELLDALGNIRAMKNISVRGLMTIAPFVEDESIIRSAFSRCAELYRRIGSDYGISGFDTLSMGMSGDFAAAIEEGATLVRIGSSIFGSRQ